MVIYYMGVRDKEIEQQKTNRLGEENLNNQGCLMKIVEYNKARDIIVEFQDEYRFKVHTRYEHFISGNVRNPYHPSVLNVGITGNKYPDKINGRITKEYTLWHNMIQRCYDEKYKEKKPTYKDVTCCKEWLLYENFYEWLHEQENFDKWLNNDYAIDKDIIIKNNKMYSPEACCLVPSNVNALFIKRDNCRGNFPVGVAMASNGFKVGCSNQLSMNLEYLGTYSTPEVAFYTVYKPYKENLIKQIAKNEYSNGNITRKCYDSMMKYEVEITD